MSAAAKESKPSVSGLKGGERVANAQVADVQVDNLGWHDVVVRVQHLGLVQLVSASLRNTLLRRLEHLLGTSQIPHPPIRLSKVHRTKLEHPSYRHNRYAHPVRCETQRERARDGEECAVRQDHVGPEKDFRAPREEGKDVRVGNEDRGDAGG